jgi:hypothetical protein
LRAKLEQTHSEDLQDASFLGKLLVLPANVRLDWKVIARYKHSSLFGLIFSNEEKKFYNIHFWSEEADLNPDLAFFPVFPDCPGWPDFSAAGPASSRSNRFEASSLHKVAF